MKTFRTMLKIEGRLYLRDMNMPIFAIAMPLIVLVILGMIYGKKPAFAGADYTFLEQSFGALCSIAICAGGLMGLPILVSDYRERRILKRFSVTPVSPTMILTVHLMIYSLYSAASVVLLWIVSKIFFGFRMRGSVLLFIGGWLLVLISILSIGMLVGGIAKNSKIASVYASILYFPMLVFSGATLPYEIMPVPMQKIVDIMPLTQGIKILKAATLGESLNAVTIPVIIMLALAAVCIGCAIRFFRWE
ncbi:MAG: ABC transporter permease [bacterium]|nr:ABC transporter permease [bacterium]